MRTARLLSISISISIAAAACGGSKPAAEPSGGDPLAPGGLKAEHARAVAESKCRETTGKAAVPVKEGRFGWAFRCEGAESTPGVGLLVVFRDGEAQFLTTSVSPDQMLLDLEAGYRPPRR